MRGSLLLLLSILGSAAGALLPRSHPEGGRSTQRGGRTRSQRMIVLEQQCREFASSLQLPPCTEQQDAVRSRLQHTIRSNRKWRDAHVHAYGSTACGLHTAASDFDFTVGQSSNHKVFISFVYNLIPCIISISSPGGNHHTAFSPRRVPIISCS